MDQDREFFECDCHAEGVMLTHFPETDALDHDYCYLSIWAYRDFGGRDRWRERVRWIWRILRKGKLEEDEIVLNRATARRLGERLVALAVDDAEPGA